MNGWMSLLLVSFAISLDGLSVGVTYGLRKMRIPFVSMMVIGCCSFAVVFAVMQFGGTLMRWLTPEAGQQAGAAILVLIGGFTCWKIWRDRARDECEEEEPRPPVDEPIRQFRMFGVIIQILRDPSHADADRSGDIRGLEAVMLGLALSLDAFGAGISLSLLGYSALLAAFTVAISSASLLCVGIAIGRRAHAWNWVTRLVWLPPLLLIGIGLVKGFL